MNRFIFMLIAFGIAGSLAEATAGTVTFTGSCYNNLFPGNIIKFSLSNTGNDSALNLLISPNIHKADVNSSVYAISALPPGGTANALFMLSNISFTGTEPYYFVVTYQQGAGTQFITLFPCLLTVGNATTSAIDMSVETHRYSDYAYINASMTNGGPENITANVTALLPPELILESNETHTLSFGPYATRYLNLTVKFSPQMAAYTGAIALSYMIKNKSYGTFASIVINTSPSRTLNYVDVFIAAFVVLVAIFAALLIRSAMRSRKRDHTSNTNTN